MLFRGCVVCLSVLVLACSKNSGEATANVWLVAPTVKSGPADQVAMVSVAAGEFIMGRNRRDKEGLQQRYGFPFPLFLDGGIFVFFLRHQRSVSIAHTTFRSLSFY